MPRILVRAAVSLAFLGLMGTLFAAVPDPNGDFKPPPTAPVSKFVNAKLEKADGEAVNGLKLTISTRRDTLTAQAAEKAGDPLKTQPTKFRLTFENVGDKAIKFDAYDLTNRLKLVVVGPEPDTVSSTVRASDRRAAVPNEADYPTIEAGQSWGLKDKLAFPGNFGVDVAYTLHKPGEYKLQLICDRPARPDEPKLSADAWHGKLVSNTLTIKVEPAAPEAAKPADKDKPAEPPKP